MICRKTRLLNQFSNKAKLWMKYRGSIRLSKLANLLPQQQNYCENVTVPHFQDGVTQKPVGKSPGKFQDLISTRQRADSIFFIGILRQEMDL